MRDRSLNRLVVMNPRARIYWTIAERAGKCLHHVDRVIINATSAGFRPFFLASIKREWNNAVW